MKIDFNKYQILTYKALDINEGIVNLGRTELDEATARKLINDLLLQLEELKAELKGV